MSPDLSPRGGFSLLKRALLGGMLITLLSAAAVASAAFLEIEEVTKEIERSGRAPIVLPEIDRADAGSARTIMVLGSDLRYVDKKNGIKPRSDTIILVRLDPDKEAVSVMSIPRDLKVTIPGNDVPTKINAAFEQGGERLTLKTVKAVLGTRDRPFPINNVVTINFGAFRRAVNYIGCVYYDVDRRYFNDNVNVAERYATIDIKPGYQKLCGKDALDYVRHRHSDNDLFRAARQQDFLRQLKSQGGIRKLMDPRQGKELAKVFARYLDSDAGLRRTKNLFGLAKLAIFSAEKPVREVEFRITGEEGNGAYLTASQEAIDKTVDEFMAARAAVTSKKAPPAVKKKRKKRPKKRVPGRSIPGLVSASREGEDQAVLLASKVRLPFYFPTLKRAGGVLDGGLSSEPTTRVYSIRDERGKLHRAYRMTVRLGDSGFPEPYGIQGTTWRNPPILDDPSETVTRNGRKLELYYDGRDLRLVAWRTPRAVYWVSNTLRRKLTNPQMIGIAASLRRLR